ncbi:hypothetical protein VNO78_10934 [Psophocarpus tetragonolobus]|uniref:Uncharacterized protein n=1 Tax=Psophocarpus tetragonolobus TaxID=3891 RepID=A0AAN9XN72_PSOTE
MVERLAVDVPLKLQNVSSQILQPVQIPARPPSPQGSNESKKDSSVVPQNDENVVTNIHGTTASIEMPPLTPTLLQSAPVEVPPLESIFQLDSESVDQDKEQTLVEKPEAANSPKVVVPAILIENPFSI